jgi:hypothetical protein
MWTYIVAAFFIVMGIFELTLAFHGPLRRAILEASPVRSQRTEPLFFMLLGGFGILSGVAILLYGLYW